MGNATVIEVWFRIEGKSVKHLNGELQKMTDKWSLD